MSKSGFCSEISLITDFNASYHISALFSAVLIFSCSTFQIFKLLHSYLIASGDACHVTESIVIDFE
jgi:hypothetical protein